MHFSAAFCIFSSSPNALRRRQDVDAAAAVDDADVDDDDDDDDCAGDDDAMSPVLLLTTIVLLIGLCLNVNCKGDVVVPSFVRTCWAVVFCFCNNFASVGGGARSDSGMGCSEEEEPTT